jgi:hypothetical protein
MVHEPLDLFKMLLMEGKSKFSPKSAIDTGGVVQGTFFDGYFDFFENCQARFLFMQEPLPTTS